MSSDAPHTREREGELLPPAEPVGRARRGSRRAVAVNLVISGTYVLRRTLRQLAHRDKDPDSRGSEAG